MGVGYEEEEDYSRLIGGVMLFLSQRVVPTRSSSGATLSPLPRQHTNEHAQRRHVNR